MGASCLFHAGSLILDAMGMAIAFRWAVKRASSFADSELFATPFSRDSPWGASCLPDLVDLVARIEAALAPDSDRDHWVQPRVALVARLEASDGRE